MGLLRRDDGQTSVEYAMILLLITGVLVLALVGLIGPAKAFFESIPELISP